MDQGFVISDHVDWPSLLEAVRLSNAETIWVDHGYSEVVARYLCEKGMNAISIDDKSRSSTEEDSIQEPTEAMT
jgi:putative mRNA 3-end processing factor